MDAITRGRRAIPAALLAGTIHGDSRTGARRRSAGQGLHRRPASSSSASRRPTMPSPTASTSTTN